MGRNRSSRKTNFRERYTSNRAIKSGDLTKLRTPGQSDQIAISVAPVDSAFDTLCNSFVLTTLILGGNRQSASTYLAALKFVFKNSMADGARLPQKAPRIFWQVDNLLRPKKITHKGLTISYSFNIDNWDYTTDPNNYGTILGSPGAELPNQGLFGISSASMPTVTLSQATDILNEMFAFWQEKVPLITHVTDFIYDASAFAWKTPLFERQNDSDETMSAYSRVELEVPITHWSGYCGLASQYCYGLNQNNNARIPKFSRYCQGNAGQHAGLRMFNPKFMAREHVLTNLNMAPVDLQQWFEVNADILAAMKKRIVGADRPQGVAIDAPDAYRENTVSKNLFQLYRYAMIITNFASFAQTWAGAQSTGLAAAAVGTNNIDMTVTKGMSDWYYNLANARQLKPVFNKRTRAVTVPFPVVFEGSVAQWNTLHDTLLATSVPPNEFGGDDLDLLNSKIGSAYVSLIDGLTLRDDLQLVAISDGNYTNVMPVGQATVADVSPTTQIPVQATIIIPAQSTQDAAAQVAKVFSFKIRDPERAKQAFNKWEKIWALRCANRDARKKMGTMAADRTSIDTTSAIDFGIMSEVPFDTSINLENIMTVPVRAPPSYDFPDQLRLMFDTGSSIKSGLQVQKNYAIAKSSQAMSLTKDPTSTQGSEVTTAMLDMSKGLFGSISPSWGPILDSAIGGINPRARAGIAAGGAVVQVVKQVVQAVRTRRAANGKGPVVGSLKRKRAAAQAAKRK